MTVSVTLTPDLEARLHSLAAREGCSEGDFLLKAIEYGLEDLEDYAEAAEVLQRVRSGQEETMSSKDFWRDLDD